MAQLNMIQGLRPRVLIFERLRSSEAYIEGPSGFNPEPRMKVCGVGIKARGATRSNINKRVAKYISKFTKLTLWGLSLTSLCLVFFAVVLLQVVLSPQPIIPAQTPNSESPCPHPRKGTPLWGAPGRCRATCRTSMVGTIVKFEFRVSGLRLELGLGPRPRA